MRLKCTGGAVVSLAFALAVAEDVSSVERRWGTLTSEPTMPFDPKTKQPCALWYNNDGDESCEEVVSETWTDMVDFLRWVTAPKMRYARRHVLTVATEPFY
jgi:hypothetical protein